MQMDRISSLPDDFLIVILSTLKTKEAVQTCILSKRWAHLWSVLPVLKFDIKDWVDVENFLNDKVKLKEGHDKFARYLSSVVENRRPVPLDLFEYHNSVMDCVPETAIRFPSVVALNPHAVHLEFSKADRFHRWNLADSFITYMPDMIFSCKSLEKLCLHIHIDVIRPEAIHLPSLKVFELKGMWNIDNDFVQMLLMGCPVLETLVLYAWNLQISKISSNMLKKLSLDCCTSESITPVCCPNLTCLDIKSEDRWSGLQLENMPLLEDAVICLESVDVHRDLNLLNGLSNVSELSLALWHDEFEVKLEKDISGGRTFNNLKILEFLDWDHYNKDLLAHFLKHSPCLKELIIYPANDYDIEDEPSQEELTNLPWQREHLDTLTIVKFSRNSRQTVTRLMKFLYTHVKNIGNILHSTSLRRNIKNDAR